MKPRMPRKASTPGLRLYQEELARTERERPSQRVTCTMEIARFVADIRTGLKIRQVDLATRAHVGRHWLMALEQGKQSLEVEPVLRVLQTLGFELELKPFTPIPPWITVAKHMADGRARRAKVLRNQRRNGKRALERANRLNANAPTVQLDLE